MIWPLAVFFFSSNIARLESWRDFARYGDGNEDADVTDGCCCNPSGSLRLDEIRRIDPTMYLYQLCTSIIISSAGSLCDVTEGLMALEIATLVPGQELSQHSSQAPAVY